MISFNLDVGGTIKIKTMDSEESGKIEYVGVLTFLKQLIGSSIGLHGCLTVQVVKGSGPLVIPNDLRFVLDNNGVGYSESKTEGFVETQPQPIPADEVR